MVTNELAKAGAMRRRRKCRGRQAKEDKEKRGKTTSKRRKNIRMNNYTNLMRKRKRALTWTKKTEGKDEGDDGHVKKRSGNSIQGAIRMKVQ